ncbi:MAG: DUF4956 domain-containing protein [Anaerolineales bacterium]|nr:DUF4956 domain-containing protein [Anaerolineales bacterium]
MVFQNPQQLPQQIDVDSLLRANSPTNALFSQGPISLSALAVGLVIGLILSLVVQWHYKRFASTLSSRDPLTKVFPLIVLTTLLIITIVKSSLALSLGLVGALSIVRFRTPIKEPEELAYLFICIAIGLGLGANQFVPTIVGTAFILLIAGYLGARGKLDRGQNLYLSIDWEDGKKSPRDRLDALTSVLSEFTTHSDLRRLDTENGTLAANFYARFSSPEALSELVERLDREYNQEIRLSVVDQSRIGSG